mmetsp:Transcript_25757/g.66364  ORF Transcript_25757/g.66364 Transcript_25757/m.66364 type:complete len:551 (+) Transcript_25757:146-1798(+)
MRRDNKFASPHTLRRCIAAEKEGGEARNKKAGRVMKGGLVSEVYVKRVVGKKSGIDIECSGWCRGSRRRTQMQREVKALLIEEWADSDYYDDDYVWDEPLGEVGSLDAKPAVWDAMTDACSEWSESGDSDWPALWLLDLADAPDSFPMTPSCSDLASPRSCLFPCDSPRVHSADESVVLPEVDDMEEQPHASMAGGGDCLSECSWDSERQCQSAPPACGSISSAVADDDLDSGEFNGQSDIYEVTGSANDGDVTFAANAPEYWPGPRGPESQIVTPGPVMASIFAPVVMVMPSFVPDPSFYYGLRFAVPTMARSSAGWATLKQLLESEATQDEVLYGMAGYVVDMSYQRWGTRVVQYALDVSPAAWQQFLVSEMQGHVCPLALHLHGNHVIQKVLEVIPSSALSVIHDELVPQAVKVAGHEYGCRVFQRVVEHEVPAALEWVLEAGLDQLSWDKFGHHVVEALLERGSDEVRARMVQTVIAGVDGVLCSRHAGKAYACRVIERVLRVEVAGSGHRASRRTFARLETRRAGAGPWRVDLQHRAECVVLPTS